MRTTVPMLSHVAANSTAQQVSSRMRVSVDVCMTTIMLLSRLRGIGCGLQMLDLDEGMCQMFGWQKTSRVNSTLLGLDLVIVVFCARRDEPWKSDDFNVGHKSRASNAHIDVVLRTTCKSNNPIRLWSFCSIVRSRTRYSALPCIRNIVATMLGARSGGSDRKDRTIYTHRY